MKTLYICLIILSAGCSEYPSVVRVCVNYLEPESYCGTGFFTAPNKLMTAEHITVESEDNILTAIGPGINETSHYFTPYGVSTNDSRGDEGEMMQASFDTNVTSEICPICDGMSKVGTSVALLGVMSSGPKHQIEYRYGTLVEIGIRHIWIDGSVPQGFSGGPVIDEARSCVIGMTQGTQNGTIVVESLAAHH